jgi:hypothetical protein
VKRGGSLSFLVRTISNVLVMEIGLTDVGSGGYIFLPATSLFYECKFLTIEETNKKKKTSITVSTAH